MGANLRSTRLDNAAITEVIRCGRPNTGMPRFDEGAYTQRGCYGQPTGAVPDALYPTPRMLSPQEIELVVTYLRARVIGKRTVTPEECAYYYGELADTATPSRSMPTSSTTVPTSWPVVPAAAETATRARSAAAEASAFPFMAPPPKVYSRSMCWFFCSRI